MSINHGANLFDLSSKLGLNKTDIKDFSSNINPFGASKKAKNAILENIDMVSMYPDPKYTALKEAISEYCNCKKENIIVGSGATELISSFISIINPKKALLLSPSYSEYESELEKINCEIVKFFSKEEDDFKIDVHKLINSINSSNYDLVIICNPNNPTGFAFSKDEISSLLKNTSTIFMVDETYVEFTEPEIYSSTPLVDNFSNLFVIRGTSKFFSTPGIRLGYGLISNKKIKEEMLEKLDLWNINIFATTMGEIMFKDKEYITSNTSKLKEERDFLFKELSSIEDLKVYESYSNFILCKITSKKLTATELYNKLLEKGLIIRNCSSFEGLNEYFFRVCVLKPEDNKLLIENLKNLFL
ncbi:histidinol-phosphate transaminase [Clostridium sp. LIBA-8841]|uniref:pyridoxal phosphate-dependent aminotransferase n=1 Tax=Clostridium sp. LIBA-8841 TaxID=2987530 RepID=UPI002AC417E9|nr:histidinol-phosphate transaminase [Clostridium sp. LIBA-8841]MDZ5252266.1 aminotransferase class I/II-fold pyridoxal phosphate-dependent enzyme [Clostridium sp. LIBA-8841]